MKVGSENYKRSLLITKWFVYDVVMISRNGHQMTDICFFAESLLHWSDIIGASHSPGYTVWSYGQLATSGVKEVCEYGWPRTLEGEIKLQVNHKYRPYCLFSLLCCCLEDILQLWDVTCVFLVLTKRCCMLALCKPGDLAPVINFKTDYIRQCGT